MKEINIEFDKVNIPLDSKIIDELGEKYAQTSEDKPMFIIKTSHFDEIMVPDKNELCGFKMEPYTEIKIFVLTVFKISNGWIGTIDGHFTSDYNGYIITDIVKLNY